MDKGGTQSKRKSICVWEANVRHAKQHWGYTSRLILRSGSKECIKNISLEQAIEENFDVVRDVAANNIWICVHLCMFTFSMLYVMLATTHQVLNTLVTTGYLTCFIPVPTSGNKI